jgi:hypothetical protein
MGWRARRPARARLVEVLGAVPNRTQVKRRKAREPVGELVFGSEAHIRRSGRVVATGLARSPVFLPSEISRPPPCGVAVVEDERTR